MKRKKIKLNHFPEILGEYVNGNYNVAIFSDGTKVRETDDNEFVPEYAENCDVQITSRCGIGCKFCYAGASEDGKHGDLSYDFLNHLHPYTEMALNGNDLDHPDLIPFLEKLKSQNVLANMTFNQIQFERNLQTIKNLVKDKLIYGIGVSLVNPTDEFIRYISEFDNAVIHTINGLLSEEQVKKLSYHNIKMLVLGYKLRGRGDSYYDSHKDLIESRKKWLNDNLSKIYRRFNVISFDNLALEQLPAVKEIVGDKWDEFYMGDDGKYTFYIDLVNGTFAKNSCIEENFPIGNKSIDEMFKFIREKYSNIESDGK